MRLFMITQESVTDGETVSMIVTAEDEAAAERVAAAWRAPDVDCKTTVNEVPLNTQHVVWVQFIKGGKY